MQATLDSSQQFVIQHAETIIQMNECTQQAQDYFGDFCSEEFVNLAAQSNGLISAKSRIDQDWHELRWTNPALGLKSLCDDKISLLGLGIEHATVQAALGIDPNRKFTVYVYILADAFTQVNTLERFAQCSVPHPNGLPPSRNNAKEAGYLFRKEFDAIPADDFCDPLALVGIVRSPMLTLMEWLRRHESAISNSLQKRLLGSVG